MIKITEENIRKYLGDLPFEFKIFDEIDSTNSFAKENLKNNRVVISEMQTNGRGRQGRDFYSPKDNGIYMSVIFKVDKSFSDISLFTVAMASITADAIEKVSGKTCKIKWVNDIFVENKKVCGILCENVLSKQSGLIEYVVAGIGINIKTTDNFPEELKEIAGALSCGIDRCELVSEILKGCRELQKDYQFKSYLDNYRNKSMVLCRNITFVKNDITYTGKVKKINDMGNLEVVLKDGEIIILNSGEIRLSYNDIC